MKTVFLMVARVLYDKGYTEYVEAARIVRKEYPDAEFHLLGAVDTAYPKHVPEEVIKKDHAEGVIHYLGYTPNVRPIMQTADCIVLPSYHEGLSRVLIEALAMGKPIITSDIPGCRETVEEGRNGYLVPPRNIEALANAVRSFLSLTLEERRFMGRYGRMKAEREFDVNNVIAVYRRITG